MRIGFAREANLKEKYLPRRPSPNPSPLSEAGGRALQFCRIFGCRLSGGVAVRNWALGLRWRVLAALSTVPGTIIEAVL